MVNDLFLFVIGKWSAPTVTGAWPPPCHWFTLTMVDGHRALLFGGVGGGGISLKHVFVLDIERIVSDLNTADLLDYVLATAAVLCTQAWKEKGYLELV